MVQGVYKGNQTMNKLTEQEQHINRLCKEADISHQQRVIRLEQELAQMRREIAASQMAYFTKWGYGSQWVSGRLST